ncbi:dUTP diphosphatase [Serpentinicella alkaliphila]|uniref:Dimeric dUTPase (All-alpha-NTP-PPase superfamily) n=1 Tax=Serpentinicella alkaliphila TaxID=1734049 RepID=A0A4R2TT81_9FIRM|nr:dUTP diphosphatase [Serpentinicella alkaliphila]QUH25297.1 dUTP diphosphatase [Serpentinicella alkaliphila]TCQ07110.1 dimeric dUTPase (all-alpha-NTP-PPase superfamily) [Serpentinicella alkaliphila]
MELHQLFYIQSQLDKKIAANHNLYKQDLTSSKILALLVELGELANETRCFKFWSLKGPSEKEKIIEEYVDCLHFILSIGLDNGFVFTNIEVTPKEGNLVDHFQSVFSKTIQIKEDLTDEKYLALFTDFLSLSHSLGFSYEDIFKSYMMKNEINHKRQAEGY